MQIITMLFIVFLTVTPTVLMLIWDLQFPWQKNQFTGHKGSDELIKR